MTSCFTPRSCARACSFSAMTGPSSPPTISSVGAWTRASAAPARSGRPPRETTAPTRVGPRGGRDQRRAAAGAGAEVARRAGRASRAACRQPVGRADEPLGQQADVEAQVRRCAGRPLSSSASAGRSAASPGPASLQHAAPRSGCAGCGGCCRCRGRTARRPRALAGRLRSPSSVERADAGPGPLARRRAACSVGGHGTASLRSPTGRSPATSPRLPRRRALQRLDGARLVEVDHGVELRRQLAPGSSGSARSVSGR